MSQNYISMCSSSCAICNMVEELERGETIISLQSNRRTNSIEMNCVYGIETHLEMQPVRSAAETFRAQTHHLIQPQRKFFQKKNKKRRF